MIDFPFFISIFVLIIKISRMKKILLFVASALMAMSVSAQTVTLTANSWDEGGVTKENSQGSVAISPSQAIKTGYTVSIAYAGTTTGGDVSLSLVAIDTTGGGWATFSSWGSANVTSGAIAGTFTFTATADVVSPILVLSTAAGTSYNDVTISFSNLTCTVTDPSYHDPNVLTDDSYLPLNGIASSWGNCTVTVGTDSTAILFPLAWDCGAGWAWWGLAPAYLDVTEFESVTVEFDAAPCQVALVVQTDNGTDGGENNQKIAAAGATSITINFIDDAVFIGDIWAGVCAIYLQTGEANATVAVTGAYFTYKSMTAIDGVAQNIQINNGFVASEGTISVYTIDGKKVAEAAKEFNMNSLPKGVYFIQTVEGAAKYLK
jgi:hypothetical protein